MKAQIYVNGKLVWIKRIYKNNCNEWKDGDWLIDPEIITKVTAENIQCGYEIVDIETLESQFIEKNIIQAAFPYIDYIIDNWEKNEKKKLKEFTMEPVDTSIIKPASIKVVNTKLAKIVNNTFDKFDDNDKFLLIIVANLYQIAIPKEDLITIRNVINKVLDNDK